MSQMISASLAQMFVEDRELKGNHSSAKKKWCERKLTVTNMNPLIHEAEYAVRGAVIVKAGEVHSRMTKGESFPFSELTPCNIGNPQAVRQKPITFYRDIAARCIQPSIMEGEVSYVADRAREYLAATKGNGMGAYTESNGLQFIREQVAKFIEKRDGYPCDPDSISLTTGASEGVKRMIQCIISGEEDGILIPCPQYPLYSCAITMFGGSVVYYGLNEEKGWGIEMEELERSFAEATEHDIKVKAIAVINPGNPSGAVLSKSDIRDVLEFAHRYGILVLADEVYQENIYTAEKPFHSFKKVLRELQADHPGEFDGVQLVSFHSTSKGLIGECGQRGGYMEMVGFSQGMLRQFGKMAASSLSSNTLGQVFVGMMVTPPQPGDESYDQFTAESSEIYEGLKRRAKLLHEELNTIEGISCQPIEGAMYAFPCVGLPAGAIEEANRRGIAADELYCLQMVEETGIICVPGSGFGQDVGTFHFRMTILPPDDMMHSCVEKIKEFHQSFCKRYV